MNESLESASSVQTPGDVSSGTIILLNGTSSSGKSTLAKALQDVLERPYLHAGIDQFIYMLPKRYLYQPHWHEVFHYVWTKDDPPIIEAIEAGPMGHRLMSGMHHTVAAFARAGNNVIVDHVLLDPQWLRECVQLFSGLPVLFVGVRCPLDVVEERERDREDRTLGQARAQYDHVHVYGSYDVDIDTSTTTAEQCAEQIKHYLETTPILHAFKRIEQTASHF